jgi:hypothetical protein
MALLHDINSLQEVDLRLNYSPMIDMIRGIANRPANLDQLRMLSRGKLDIASKGISYDIKTGTALPTH